MKFSPYIGAHVSIRGGYGQAARSARESGAACFQYFPKNPRSLKLKPVDYRDAESCAAYCREQGMVSIGHSAYPTNLAAAPEDREVMTASLRNDLEIAEACGSLGIVVHFGHFAGMEPLQGYQNIIQCINDTLADWHGQSKLLIENMAGNQGREGMTLEELVKIRELSRNPEKIGFCFDTCHAFASGIWNPLHTGAFLKRGSKLGFWDNLVAVHLNDSRYPCGARRDRHAGVGQGHIGSAALQELVTLIPVSRPVFVMETEKGPDGTHRTEIALVRKWFEAGDEQ
ncbi:deoxyribonuclease IV [Paenibacillus sp. MMS20-IR301]|uniref:deoxyribonuclease IV n=1 Tax=Paenibacillus sp. MMS20-IR301 TaxID=2895946 RepID=UPI0028EB9662|nr:deoxyribonuclease IV [Paenibacillus sp. MMS20-IR301]WNS44987.1 deoxyribonuclease IV [Paenibacillus sp. MMS20-IR301]